MMYANLLREPSKIEPYINRALGRKSYIILGAKVIKIDTGPHPFEHKTKPTHMATWSPTKQAKIPAATAPSGSPESQLTIPRTFSAVVLM